MSDEIKELSIWELYFSTKGRLSSKDFTKFYFFPSIALVALIAVWLILDGKTYKGDEFYLSLPYLVTIAITVPMTLIAFAKRSRDFNFPSWYALFPFFLLALFYNLPLVFPPAQDLVNTFFNDSSSSLSLTIVFIYWMPKTVDEGNLYGPPCKVVLFKKRARL